MGSSRKYPYPHHRGNFTRDPPSSLEFPFFEHTQKKTTPPEFPQVLCTPPIPSRKIILLARKGDKVQVNTPNT